ncbi:MAG: hypothetical protein H0U28_00755 [Nocardioidaceae bacterium]|nr:hypothetical protein [Nocardioidaceae bacterium]
MSLTALAAVALFSRRHDGPDQAPSPGPPTGVTSPAAADRPAPPGTAAPTLTAPPPGPARRQHGAKLFWVTTALIAIALGTIWILEETGYADVPLSMYPGTTLGIIAAALVVGAWYGRSRVLIPLGFVASLATIAAGIIGPGPHGERTYRPATAAEVRAGYQHGAGQITVHLEDVAHVDRLDGRTIDITASVGEVRLVVPTSIDATVTAHVAGGEIHGTTEVQDFGGGERRAKLIPADDADPDVTIDVELRYGVILVYRFDCPEASYGSIGQSTSVWMGDDRDPAACD